MVRNFYTTLFLLFSVLALKAQTTDDYRSTASGGAWETVGTWERFNGSTWVAASVVPSSAGTVNVLTITAGSTVTVGAASSGDQIVVDGNLVINLGITLTVANGAGTDMAISGTGTVLNKGTITSTGAALTCAGGGTYIHNTASSGSNIMASFGTTGLAATSNFIYRGSSTLNPPYSFGGRTYGNLIFESESGAWSTTNFSATTPTTINGTLKVGATNVGTVTLTETAQTGALTIAGGIEIGAASYYSSRASTANPVTVNGNSTIGTSGTLNIQAQSFINNGTITGTGFLRFGSATTTAFSGSGSVNVYQIRISTTGNVTLSQSATCSYFVFFNVGNLINSNNLTVGTGSGIATIQFGQTGGTAGTGAFDVAPNFNVGSGLAVFYLEQAGAKTTGFEIPASREILDMTITNVNGVTLSGGDLTVTGVSYMTGNTGAHLTLGANNITVNGGISGADAGAHFVTNSTGALKQPVSGSMAFPVGVSSTSFDPATVNNSGTADVFAVRVGSTVTAPANPLLVVNRQWEIAEAVAGGSNCTLDLTYDAAATTGASYSASGTMVMGHYDGALWSETPATIASTTVTAGGFTAFSPYAVANASGLLPLDLLSFSGKVKSNSNLLTWTTANEVNVQRIVVEREVAGGTHFESIGSVAPKGKADGGIAQYELEDRAPLNDAFYRLVVVDLDGKISFSGIVHLEREGANGGVRVYPNPTADQATVEFTAESEGEINIQVVDMQGKIISSQDFSVEADQTAYFPLEVKALPTGMYSVKISQFGAVLEVLPLVKK